MTFCDLHTHSVYSDGTFTPAELIDAAMAAGLSAIALTDHNTVDGLPDFLAAAAGKPILAIPGAEFSVDYNGKELHLLGLFIPQAHFSTVADLMEDFIRRNLAGLLQATLVAAGRLAEPVGAAQILHALQLEEHARKGIREHHLLGEGQCQLALVHVAVRDG